MTWYKVEGYCNLALSTSKEVVIFPFFKSFRVHHLTYDPYEGLGTWYLNIVDDSGVTPQLKLIRSNKPPEVYEERRKTVSKQTNLCPGYEEFKGKCTNRQGSRRRTYLCPRCYNLKHPSQIPVIPVKEEGDKND